MTTRREFLRWTTYLGAAAILPAVAGRGKKDRSWDVLEGISFVGVKLAELSGNPVKFREQEDGAFIRAMEQMWREEWGTERNLLRAVDCGIVPRCFMDPTPHNPACPHCLTFRHLNDEDGSLRPRYATSFIMRGLK